jgi:hypothetical protein
MIAFLCALFWGAVGVSLGFVIGTDLTIAAEILAGGVVGAMAAQAFG